MHIRNGRKFQPSCAYRVTAQRCLLAQHRLRVGVAPNGHSRAVAPRHAAPADRHRVAPHETSCLFKHIAIGHGSASGAHSAAHSACSARRQYVSDVHASTTRSPCAHGLRTSQQHSQQSAESPNRFGLWIRCCDWVRSDSQPIQPNREGKCTPHAAAHTRGKERSRTCRRVADEALRCSRSARWSRSRSICPCALACLPVEPPTE